MGKTYQIVLNPRRGIAKLTLRQRQAITAYILLAPALIFFTVFFFYPFVLEFLASLRDGQPFIGPSEYVGLKNYTRALEDSRVINSFKVTAIFALGSTFFNTLVGLGLALLLNQKLRGRIVIRSIIFFPFITSSVIVSLMWRNILDPYIGVLNNLLFELGLPTQNLLTSIDGALPLIIALTVWQNMGYAMVLFLAGLQNIPQDYYDASKIDGAGSWARFRFITIPLLSPTTVFVTTISTISNLQAFAPAYLITRGGPADATRLYGYHIFNVAFSELNFGYASAQAFLMFIVILGMTLIQLKLGRSDVEYR